MHLLQAAHQLEGYTLQAVDGEIGRLEEFYFDGVSWAVCYLLVHTADWLTDEYVLISPIVIGDVDDQHRTIDVELTRQQIQTSPLLNINSVPAGRSAGDCCYRFFQVSAEISGLAMTGAPIIFPLPAGKSAKSLFEKIPLYSSAEISGYEVLASDGKMGVIEDFIIDTQYWLIRYLQVAADDAGINKHLLISPEWSETLRSNEQLIRLDMEREHIKRAPGISATGDISRSYEARLFRHYGRPVYWSVHNKTS